MLSCTTAGTTHVSAWRNLNCSAKVVRIVSGLPATCSQLSLQHICSSAVRYLDLLQPINFCQISSNPTSLRVAFHLIWVSYLLSNAPVPREPASFTCRVAIISLPRNTNFFRTVHTSMCAYRVYSRKSLTHLRLPGITSPCVSAGDRLDILPPTCQTRPRALRRLYLSRYLSQQTMLLLRSRNLLLEQWQRCRVLSRLEKNRSQKLYLRQVSCGNHPEAPDQG